MHWERWLDALFQDYPEHVGCSASRREHELLLVRSRDVLEHIERVVRHVRRLKRNAETAVQILLFWRERYLARTGR